MQNPEINEMVKGIVPPTEIELAELALLKSKILKKYENNLSIEFKEEFSEKASFLLAGLPEGYWIFDWDNCKADKKIMILLKKYCDNLNKAFDVGQGIILVGEHGTGKTALSCLVGKTALKMGYTVRYISIAKIIDLISQTFNSQSAKERLDTIFERVEILILDDLGKEYKGVREQLNPMISLKLDSILRERINRNLITIGSTNFDLNTMRRKYGNSVMSVLIGCAKIIQVKGEDFRQIRGIKFWKELEN